MPQGVTARKLCTMVAPLLAMLIALPLLGVALAAQPLAPYLAFPPLTDRVSHAPFSWNVFVAVALLVLACVTPFVYCLVRNQAPALGAPRERRDLPWWGWFGVAILALAWWLAWNRFSHAAVRHRSACGAE